MTIIEQARDIVAAHYEAKGWTTRAAQFRAGAIQCADDVDLVVRVIEATAHDRVETWRAARRAAVLDPNQETFASLADAEHALMREP